MYRCCLELNSTIVDTLKVKFCRNPGLRNGARLKALFNLEYLPKLSNSAHKQLKTVFTI